MAQDAQGDEGVHHFVVKTVHDSQSSFEVPTTSRPAMKLEQRTKRSPTYATIVYFSSPTTTCRGHARTYVGVGVSIARRHRRRLVTPARTWVLGGRRCTTPSRPHVRGCWGALRHVMPARTWVLGRSPGPRMCRTGHTRTYVGVGTRCRSDGPHVRGCWTRRCYGDEASSVTPARMWVLGRSHARTYVGVGPHMCRIGHDRAYVGVGDE
jgi:hypothetical protein